MKELTSRKSK